MHFDHRYQYISFNLCTSVRFLHHLDDPNLNTCGCTQQDKEELRKRERDKRKSRQAAINTLGELGFAKRDASRALHQASGDVDKAYGVSAKLGGHLEHTHTHTLVSFLGSGCVTAGAEYCRMGLREGLIQQL